MNTRKRIEKSALVAGVIIGGLGVALLDAWAQAANRS